MLPIELLSDLQEYNPGDHLILSEEEVNYIVDLIEKDMTNVD